MCSSWICRPAQLCGPACAELDGGTLNRQGQDLLKFRTVTSFHHLAGAEHMTGEGNGNPLHSCLENPMDRGAWWAAVYGIAQSRTPRTWLSSSSSSRAYDKVRSCLLEMLIHPKFRVMEWPWSGVFLCLEHFKYSPRCREECVPSGKVVFIF